MEKKSKKTEEKKKGIEEKKEILLPEYPDATADELHIFHGKTVQPGWFIDF